MKEYVVPYDTRVIDKIKGKITAIRESIKVRVAPLGVCGGPKDARAKECGYRNVCFKGHDKIEKIAELMGREPPIATTPTT
jgi:hypothetical protein